MGYLLRVRLAAFFAGSATASLSGLYFLHQDYKLAHDSIVQQMKNLHSSLDSRISAVESLKATEEVTTADITE